VVRIGRVCSTFPHNIGVIKVMDLWDGSIARIEDGLTCLTMKTNRLAPIIYKPYIICCRNSLFLWMMALSS
jgi:hypothetical protein